MIREIPEEEREETEDPIISEEEARKRFRKLAWEQPDFNFSILEALMEKLGMTKEEIQNIVKEGARKWEKA